MLSDEEKKAILELNHYCNLTQYWKNVEYTKPEFDNYITTILNLIEKQSKEIEELKDEQEKNKDMSCDLTETRADNIDESTMLKQIKLKLQEKNIPIETLLAEFERLEDLEDDLTTVYINGVYDGEKKVKNKIKVGIEELQEDIKYSANPLSIENSKFGIKVLQSLLEKE